MKKDKVDYVRRDALDEELEKEKKTSPSKGCKREVSVKVDPCEQQAQQWF